MLKKFTHWKGIILMATTILAGTTAIILAHANGSPGGYTGSPLDGKNCTSCHGGNATTKAGIITSNIGTSGYTGGNTYTITVSVPGMTGNNKGFEVSCLNSSTTTKHEGTFTAGTNSKLCDSNYDVTHSQALTTSPGVWNFMWVAPVTGTGTVTFFGAFVNSYDTVYLSTLTIAEKKATSIQDRTDVKFSIYPNPTRGNFNITFTLIEDSRVKVRILTIDGKVISEPINSIINADNHSINYNLPSSVKPGIYIVEMTIGDKMGYQELIVK